MRKPKEKIPLKYYPAIALLLLLVIPVLIIVPIYVVIDQIRRKINGHKLTKRVKNEWLSRGKSMLFVTSNSPVWGEYINQNIIPKIKDKAIILNWSDRSIWANDNSLENQVFCHWAGMEKSSYEGKTYLRGVEFCPIAIAFTSKQKTKIIRFWQAFKIYKRGRSGPLKKCEKELFDLI